VLDWLSGAIEPHRLAESTREPAASTTDGDIENGLKHDCILCTIARYLSGCNPSLDCLSKFYG